MAGFSFLQHVCFIVFIFIIIFQGGAADEESKASYIFVVYIVYLGSLREGESSPLSQHLSILETALDGSSSKTPCMEGVVSIFPNRLLQLHTTRSWDFMGLSETVKRNPTVESDTIIGVIDSGIWPESQSFSDEGFSSIPKKWKGVCQGGKNFTCNKKVIGARTYIYDDSARDPIGHGTHTASTAAGNKVEDVSFFELAQGNARGGVPSARIAVYKVCSEYGCQSADILAAFDDAISDGVDIITVSLGPASGATPLDADPIAIGAFHAMVKGILTLNSAGNSGPSPGSVGSVAPWMVSVAASTTDRAFVTKVVLGDGKIINGRSINTFALNGTKFPLVYGKVLPNSSVCHNNPALSPVVNVALGFGARGVIRREDGRSIFPLPVSDLGEQEFAMVEAYANSTEKAEADILKSESIKDLSAPMLASFSSRGPSNIIAEIKPDISAPGVNILAAFSPIVPIMKYDKRRAKYSMLSGTSMSCPHAAGAAAYVKTFHPDWSPSAIRSALMTTAWPMNATANPAAEFGYGSGHINPAQAIDPGLVYEAFKDDYTKMMCGMGYDTRTVRLISGDNTTTCTTGVTEGAVKDLNYPSMASPADQHKPFNISFLRTVTNVGQANSTYQAKITADPLMKVQVNPNVLSFTSLNEKKSLVVTVSGEALDKQPKVSASLVWTDGTHSVRSPIVIYQLSST
ncbi:Subtilisin-like protease SBT4.4 [Vitis vinifera]|uniref:Subtilisin-like protease SBT4.4 n=1 Tax=Vitis vinifera TaxID=29760 RepID=A0A438CRJ4_VITVI|nr:Subtilisin-like protease SBT4.4 [Vitis vinifera]